MSGLESWLQRSSQGEAGPPGHVANVLLFPLEVAYGSAVALRNRLYDHGLLSASESPIPVISVGNIAVGGTGKTPLAAWLVRQLESRGRRPALVTRGYGTDEVALHRLWNPDAIVIADPDRVRGVALAAQRGADVAVLDDAFQHRRIGRRVDVVLCAAEHGTRAALLPRGRLRESFRSLARADLLVITRKVSTSAEAERVGARIGAHSPGVVRGQVRFKAHGWVDLEGAAETLPDGDLMAVSSVAEPQPFLEMVRAETGGRVGSLAFGDHHVFSEVDIQRITRDAEGCTVVTTEKDAVKLRTFAQALPPVRVLRLEVEWESGRDALTELVDRALERER